MTAIALAEEDLAALKKALRTDLSNINSSHLSEAIAAALGFRTHAALLAALPGQADDPAILILDDDRFEARLRDFGYQLTDGEFYFEWLDGCEALISTMPVSGCRVVYRSLRHRAWRNLMVLTINEGIRQKYFSLRIEDNRWPGAARFRPDYRDRGYVFEFKLPDGKPVKGFVKNDGVGLGELRIQVAVNPKGDGVRFSTAGFGAGDAFAFGWLERKKGAWLQSLEAGTPALSCRKWLIEDLANLEAIPIGFGDRGTFFS